MIMQKCNFHTHTKYSDGNNTSVEMIESALNFGFTSLGFSDHSYERADDSYTMTRMGEREYFREINSLKPLYSDRIALYCGIELDGESDVPEVDYDFILSSVHELIIHGTVYSIDTGMPAHVKMINEGFGGSAVDMSKAYFERLTEHVMRQKTDIVGHFDLVTKYSIIPEDDEDYINAAVESIHEIVKHCKLFELNTGAIARGLRTVPYPSALLLNEIKKCGGSIIMNSDCHYKEKLTVWFDEGERFLSELGFVKNENGMINERVRNIEIWS